MPLKKKYKINYSAEIKTNGKGIKLWIAEPNNDSYQKIINFSISSRPKNIYKNARKNIIHYIDFPKNRKIKLSIDFDIKNYFFTKQIDFRKAKIPSKKTLIFKEYTKKEKYLEQTEEIKKLALLLKNDCQKPVEIVKNIFLYIINNFKYCYPVKKRGVKNLNLKNPKGDCGEYSALFATLCRINEIPTKINTGFVVFPKNKKINEHAWNSVYLKPYGWLDIDVQYAALEKNKKNAFDKYFCKRVDNRIVFTTDYNIPIKPPIPKYYKLTYWKKQYLPINRKSVQILQPLIFATKFPVMFFKEKIKLN